jgi:DnaJ like chaperone protein
LNWWGKLIGGVSGFLLGGPLGLLVGAVLGHQFDRGMASLEGGFPGGMGHVQVQEVFFEATFSVMGHLAKSDGRVSEQEIALARQVMARMGLTEKSRLEAIRLFNLGKQADFALDDVLGRFRQVCLRRRNLGQMFVEIQLHAAYADGILNPAERTLLLHICQQLGFSAHDFQRLDAMIRAELHAAQGGRGAKTSLEDAYAILNLDAKASDAEVKRAYRRLMNQHHPDKLVAKGLPEEMMKLAEEKTHEIRAAYERIREARGF